MEQIAKENLLFNPVNGYDKLSDSDRVALNSYCDDYLKFVDQAKIEREAVCWTVAEAKAAGFVPFVPGMDLKPGDKVYTINRQKAMMLAVIGKQPMSAGTRITAAHIDSPRLDIKPNPLYEEGDMAFLKTHYYGGIKKYQWTTIPLAIHGVLALTDGSVLNVSIGENPADPVFCVTDLLPHLGAEQMKKTLAEGITGENLNILMGSEPMGEGDNRVKYAVMNLLNQKYGIVEADFLSAELTMVPAFPAREIGLDRSMIGAYGHDDRVCAYAAWYAMKTMTETPEYTSVCVLADKEEIGSEGVTGMQSQVFDTFMEDLCDSQGVKLRRCFENSKCMSADVAAAFDPTYGDVSDKRNSARVNHGVAICKYTGARGKSGASDASAETMAWFRRIFARANVDWQVTELGKVDAGGGGTVAKYMANRNIDTLDAGVAVLSMHAPYEIVSKLDCYMTMKACKVFYEN